MFIAGYIPSQLLSNIFPCQVCQLGFCIETWAGDVWLVFAQNWLKKRTNISSVLILDFGDLYSPGLPCCWTFPPPKFPKAEFEFPDPPTLFELNRLENELEFAPEAPALFEPNPFEKELELEPPFELELTPFEPELPALLELNPFEPELPALFKLNPLENEFELPISALFELNPFEPELPELLELNPLENEFEPDPPAIFELNPFEDDPSTLFELN